jgi:hypothetical protein
VYGKGGRERASSGPAIALLYYKCAHLYEVCAPSVKTSKVGSTLINYRVYQFISCAYQFSLPD